MLLTLFSTNTIQQLGCLGFTETYAQLEIYEGKQFWLLKTINILIQLKLRIRLLQ